MMFFGNRKPRGFHHQFIYVDERRDRLDRLEASARRELEIDAGDGSRQGRPFLRPFGRMRPIDSLPVRHRTMSYIVYIGILCLIGCLCICAYYILYNGR